MSIDYKAAAKAGHEAYEDEAKRVGHITNSDTRTSWEELPAYSRDLMLVAYKAGIDAALGDDVLYKFDPVQSVMQDTRLVKQAIDQGVLVQVWPVETEIQECPHCGGRGWFEEMEPDPSDPTGQTPMQFQVECSWPGHIGGSE